MEKFLEENFQKKQEKLVLAWIEIHKDEIKAAWDVYNDNGEIRKFDVKPYLNHKAFEKLKDYNEFKKVKIAGLSIEWESGADICPDELYNNSYN